MLFDGCFQVCKGHKPTGNRTRGRGLLGFFGPPPLTLLQADFCPFANRAQIALLEKEKDPYNPVLFENIHVCFVLGPEKDSGTGWLYSLGFKTVPAIIDNTNGGEAMNESMDILEKVDGMFAKDSLKPESKEAQEHMRAMIEKHSAIIGTFYKLLLEQSVEKQKSLGKTLLEQVATMNTDLKNSKGPFFCGEEFTMADIALFPFFERLIILLDHYRGFVIPEKMSHVHTWYKTIKERPSIKITTADRDDISMNTYCFEERQRAKYLVECYESYANNELDLAKKIGAEKTSSPGVNSYRKYKRKQSTEAAEGLNELVKQLFFSQ